LSIIDCLSAGYRFLGWRIELLIIPVLLDFVLWVGPRLGVAPIFDDLAATYAAAAGMEDLTADMRMTLDQFAVSVRDMGAYTNLADALVSGAAFHVPSLGPVGAIANATVITIANPFSALLLWVLFGLIGVLLGVFYLGLLARRLPIGGMAHANLGGFLGATLWHWLRAVGFVLLTFALLLMIYIPVAFLLSILMLISPTAGSLAAASAGGLVLVVFFYLYFVSAGIVMDNLGIWPAVVRSVQLVRTNFWATLGFIVLSTLIGLGIAVLLAQLAQSSVWLHVVAIFVNAYIGTGLALAFLVFYRSRLLKAQEAAS
jgi:hypothetical protein